MKKLAGAQMNICGIYCIIFLNSVHNSGVWLYNIQPHDGVYLTSPKCKVATRLMSMYRVIEIEWKQIVNWSNDHYSRTCI